MVPHLTSNLWYLTWCSVTLELRCPLQAAFSRVVLMVSMSEFSLQLGIVGGVCGQTETNVVLFFYLNSFSLCVEMMVFISVMPMMKQQCSSSSLFDSRNDVLTRQECVWVCVCVIKALLRCLISAEALQKVNATTPCCG